MGMFDYLQFEGHEYQSKDTPRQACDQYKIDIDQEDRHTYLWYEDYDAKWVDDEQGHLWLGGHMVTFNHRWIRCDDFNGKMRFYRAALEDKHESWKQDAWIEYNAIFKDGMLVHLKQVKKMEKVIRDGKVAVLISPGFGGGWHTWNHVDELLFHPKLVDMVERGLRSDIDEAFIADLLGIIDHNSMPYLGGVEQLEVRWLPLGTEFIVEDYDGSEEITIKDHVEWMKA